jgi:hypothetical protein
MVGVIAAAGAIADLRGDGRRRGHAAVAMSSGPADIRHRRQPPSSLSDQSPIIKESTMALGAMVPFERPRQNRRPYEERPRARLAEGEILEIDAPASDSPDGQCSRLASIS